MSNLSDLDNSPRNDRLAAELMYDFDSFHGILWDIANEEILRLLQKDEEYAYGILLFDLSIGVYQIVLRQHPEPGGKLHIRWGDYSNIRNFNCFLHKLQHTDCQVFELENDLCELWLYKLADLRNMDPNLSMISAYDKYPFVFFTSDMQWSLKSCKYDFRSSGEELDFPLKSRVSELVADMVLRADRERPLWKQRGLMYSIASIPDKYAIKKGLFEINFNPARNASISVTIRKSKDESKLIARFCDGKEEYKIRKEIADNFFKLVNFLSVAKQVRSNGMIFDDISISCHLSVGLNRCISFNFMSPKKAKHPRDYGIVEAVFYVFGSLRLSAPLKFYLDRLSMYFYERGLFRFVKA
jgi:hypothetical protein